MPKMLALAGLICVLLSASARQAAAVIVRLKNENEPIRGYFVRENENVVIVATVLPDGTTRERAVLRSDIQEIIRLVSDERLAALRPEDPNGYRAYADELAAEREDPDAQLMALRLYQMAAYLDPARLGYDCVRDMIPLARHAGEQRRLRAVAFLLDPTHDQTLLQVSAPPAAPTADLDPRQAQGLIKALRTLRQGNRREAMALANRYKLKQHLPELTDSMTFEEFEQACAAVCPHCTRGRQRCPQCQGTRFVSDTGTARVACPACGARGDVSCAVCGGNYQANPLPRSLLERIVRLELQWTADPKSPADVPRPARPPWSRTVDQRTLTTAPGLSIETLTEFDPRQHRFRDGRWE